MLSIGKRRNLLGLNPPSNNSLVWGVIMVAVKTINKKKTTISVKEIIYRMQSGEKAIIESRLTRGASKAAQVIVHYALYRTFRNSLNRAALINAYIKYKKSVNEDI
jgi:hypothetical protein